MNLMRWALPLLAGMAAPAVAEYKPVTAETDSRRPVTKPEAATAEVIRNALKLYVFAVDQHQDGNQFMVRYPDGKIVPAPMIKPAA